LIYPEFCVKNRKRATCEAVCKNCQRICEFAGKQHSSKYERKKTKELKGFFEGNNRNMKEIEGNRGK
jgi:hypothetical protein